LENEPNGGLFGGYLTNSVDTILINEIAAYQSVLNSTCLAMGTSYGCLLLNGRVVVASQAWWTLSANEIYLISLFNFKMSNSTTRDTPIFLPQRSCTVNKSLNLTQLLIFFVLCSFNPILILILSKRSDYYRSH
jgi:DNA topoisomerase 2-associated protein PAT1